MYNWTYKNGIVNPYGLLVPATADDATRPTTPYSWNYVATDGDDTTGNGSREFPFRTIAKAVITAGYIVLAEGTYNEALTVITGASFFGLIGDGEVTINGTGNFRVNFATIPINLYHITFTGFTSLGASGFQQQWDCMFLNATTAFQTSTAYVAIKRNIYIGSEIRFAAITNTPTVSNNTFYKCNIYFTTTSAIKTVVSDIFVECNIHFGLTAQYIDYCQFYHCNFKFSSSVTVPTTFYPSVPSGYTAINDITALRAANVTAFGANTLNFNSCSFGDPLFTNVSINDFSLTSASPARFRSRYGDYVGAVEFVQDVTRIHTINTRIGLRNPSPPSQVLPTKIAYFGDSMTGGGQDVYLYAVTPVPYINYYVSFTTVCTNTYAPTVGGQNLIDKYTLELNLGYTGQLVSFAFGQNDSPNSMANWKAAYKGIIQAFITAGWPLNRLMIILEPSHTTLAANKAVIRATIDQIASELGILRYSVFQRYIDTGRNDELLNVDTIHPTQEGQQVWAAGYATFLRQ